MENIEKIAEETITERVKQVESREKGNRDHKDFLDIYVEEYLRQKNSEAPINPDERVSFKDIVHQFITFYTAGMDTTGITAGMAL